MTIRFSLHAILIGIGITLTTMTQAQTLAPLAIPADVAAQLKAMGRVINPPATAAIYEPRVLEIRSRIKA